MAKKWKYHKSHTYYDLELNAQIKTLTQLYQIGLYVCVYGHPKHEYMQFGTTPANMVKAERGLKKNLKEGRIKDLEFSWPITAIEVDGFYKQEEDE